MNKPPIEGMKYIPYGDDIAIPAWLGLLHYSIGNKDLVERFMNETGIDIEQIGSARGINAMIDECTGRTRDVFVQFCDWVTVTLWGVEEQEISDSGFTKVIPLE